MFGMRRLLPAGFQYTYTISVLSSPTGWRLPASWPSEIGTFLVQHFDLNLEDTIKWKHGSFWFKAVWNVCREHSDPVPWCSLVVWNNNRPRIAVQTSLILHNAFPSYFNLRRRGFVGPAICYNCFSEADSRDHLFWCCPYARRVWNCVVSGVVPGMLYAVWESC
ncbi:uncharacterized protein LOC132277624 [Cornus florida]|uniref:uncharacterized protein LOC132277624 n=1 Tax=Cornus florida TaxID=4283 RepID=UPI0028A29A6C|nr:uncharacterized protein LOC132277624 [Cornus florida]